MDYLPLVQEILVKVLKSERLIQAVVLCDRTGLVILTASKDEQSGAYAVGIAALASALYGSMADQGRNMLGDLELSITEFADGKIFLTGAGKKAILVVIAKKFASVAKVRRAMKSQGKAIRKLLMKYAVDEKQPGEEEKDRLSQALDLLDF